MEYKIVTPMALWQEFNPMKEPLDVKVEAVYNTEKYISKDMIFTVETVADGKIRGYANISVRKGNDEPAPTILFIPTGEAPIAKSEFFDVLIDNGYNIITVDYGGFSPKKQKYTVYPDSLDYCNFTKFRNRPYEPTTAVNTPWFTWMKVVRRAITLAFEESSVDKSKLLLLGYIEGGQLAWKVAGIDGRVRALIPVCACGYTEYLNRPKYDASSVVQFSDELECWLAGVSTQAYAKMLMCPVYYLAGTNSTYADIDRAGDLFNLIPSKEKYMSFSVGTNENINFSNFMGAVKWANNLFDANEPIIEPILSTYISDNKLYASVKNLTDFAKVEIFYALDELLPAFRKWMPTKSQTILNKDEVLAVIYPRVESQRVFLFATVTFNSGIVISTREVMVDLSKVELDEYDTSSKVVNRFVFNGEMEEMPFSVENYNFVVDENILKIKTGPFGLKGVTATEGKLCTYIIEPPSIRGDSDYILQMEVYTPDARNVEIILYTAENGSTKYIFNLKLDGVKKWQRFNLCRSDFKNAERRQLKDWRLAKKMKIKGAENVLFNNILWI